MNNRYGIGKHTLGPIGDNLTHFLESLKAVTGSRWWVQSLSNMVRSRCYVCNMPTHKKIRSIKTYLNIIIYKRIQNDIHNISTIIHLYSPKQRSYNIYHTIIQNHVYLYYIIAVDIVQPYGSGGYREL